MNPFKRPCDDPTLRVLYVENGIGYGGAVICLRHLVRALDRRQYTPLVVTGRAGPEYAGLADDAPWKHIPDQRLDVHGWRKKREAAGGAARVPGATAVLRQVASRIDDLLNFLPFFLGLLRTAWRFDADLIHANNEPLCNRAALLVGKALRTPVVCHVRGEHQRLGRHRWAYRLPDHFISVSQWIDSGLDGLDVPPTKRSVIYDGIRLEDMRTDADGRRFRDRYAIPRDAFAVGLVGLLIPWKGQDLFIDAAKRLRDAIPNLCLPIIGGTPEECGPYEQGLRERVRAEGLEGLIVFTGHVADMPEVYNGLDVAVSASTNPEPLGTMVIETMAMGRPLVAPDHGGAAEMAVNGETAMLFRPGDPDSLAEAITSLWRDPGLRASISTAARASALETFAVARHVTEVAGVYRTVTGRGRPAASVSAS